MELRHLRYFLAVAEEENFSRAAARLHLSTPTLSQQVRALENEVGAPLFVRHRLGATLTPAGEALLTGARATLRAAEGAVADARRTAGLAADALRLGLPSGAPDWVVHQLEEIVEEEQADARLVLVPGATSHQLGLLQRGALDVALVRGPVEPAAGTEQLVVHEADLGVLMPVTHPLARARRVTCRQLSEHELIWFPRDLAPAFYDATLDALHRHGADVTVVTGTDTVPSIAATLPLVPTAVSLSTARLAAGSDALTWRPLDDCRLTETIVAVWRSRTRHPTVRAVTRRLRHELSDGPWRPQEPRISSTCSGRRRGRR